MTFQRAIGKSIRPYTWHSLLASLPLFVIVAIDLSGVQQKSLDRALFLYIFIRDVRSSSVKSFYHYCAQS